MGARDASVLRDLSVRYLAIAGESRNQAARDLHRAVNDLAMVRPVVLVDEVPWHEFNGDGQLTLQCEDPFLREIEGWLRRSLLQYRHFRADRVAPPWVPVHKVIHATDIGIRVEETTLATDPENYIVSHEYRDQLADPADLARLHPQAIRYDEAETLRRYNRVGAILGDILPVRITGLSYAHFAPWDEIASYRGVTALLTDLVDRPEYMHALVDRLTDIRLDGLLQCEAQNLFDPDPLSLHCTPATVSDLPPRDHPRLADVWGRGTAQIFNSVSPEMHAEFDIAYMNRVLPRCGLSYYGCCEPLDRKIHIVEKIPNLRKVSVTPWADVRVAAEAIAGRFVVSAKPNPAAVATGVLDRDALRKEILGILDACSRFGCACDIVLKDISTCGGRPGVLSEWVDLVMDLVTHY